MEYMELMHRVDYQIGTASIANHSIVVNFDQRANRG